MIESFTKLKEAIDSLQGAHSNLKSKLSKSAEFYNYEKDLTSIGDSCASILSLSAKIEQETASMANMNVKSVLGHFESHQSGMSLTEYLLRSEPKLLENNKEELLSLSRRNLIMTTILDTVSQASRELLTKCPLETTRDQEIAIKALDEKFTNIADKLTKMSDTISESKIHDSLLVELSRKNRDIHELNKILVLVTTQLEQKQLSSAKKSN